MHKNESRYVCTRITVERQHQVRYFFFFFVFVIRFRVKGNFQKIVRKDVKKTILCFSVILNRNIATRWRHYNG